MIKSVTSKIKTIFDDDTLRLLAAVCDARRIPSNRTKIIAICQILKEKGIKVQLLGGATNRVAFQIDGYAVKIAVDHQGFKDNLVEYAICPELQPYVTKAYETSGYVLVSECVRLLPKEEWRARKAEIIKILDILSSDYLLGDVGYIDKNRTNWGVRDDGSVVILDYAYCHRATEDLFVCNVCGDGVLVYDETYDILMCNNRGTCREKFTYNERKRIQGDQVDLDMVDEQKKLSIVIGPGETSHSVQTVDDCLIDGSVRIIHNWYELEIYKQEMEEKKMAINLQYDNEVTLSDIAKLAKLQKEDPEKAAEMLKEMSEVANNSNYGGYGNYQLSDDYNDGSSVLSTARPCIPETCYMDTGCDVEEKECLSLSDIIALAKKNHKNTVTVADDEDEYVDGVVLPPKNTKTNSVDDGNISVTPVTTPSKLIVDGVECK